MTPILARLGAGAAMALMVAGSPLASPADNKASAMAAMTDLFTRQDPTGVDRYFTSPYRQHNMRVADGLDALKALAQAATQWKGVSTTIHRGLADGDFVVLHSVYWNLLDLRRRVVAFDLFLFENGKIVEHWDCLEPVDEKAGSPNQFDGETRIVDRDKTQANRARVRDYVETVLVGGRADKAAGFIDRRAHVEHAPRDRQMFDATKPDLSTPVRAGAEPRYVKLHRVVAEGNFVFTQSEGAGANGDVLQLYDLYRLKAGKIVEHWDIRATVPPRTQWANANGPF